MATTGKVVLLHTIGLPKGMFIRAMAVSPIGSLLAVSAGGDDAETPQSTLTLWNVKTGQKIATITKQSVDGVAFSPDSRTLAYLVDASAHPEEAMQLQEALTLYNITRHKSQRRFLEAEGKAVAFSADGKRIACGIWTDVTNVIVYDAHTFCVTKRLSVDMPWPYGIAFSRNDHYVAATGFAGDAGIGGTAVWDLRTGHLLKSSEDDGVLQFSSDSHTLFCGSEAVNLTKRNGKFERLAGALSRHELVSALTGDRALFRTTTNNATRHSRIELWDLRTTRELRRWRRDFRPNTDTISANGGIIAEEGGSGHRSFIKVWRLE